MRLAGAGQRFVRLGAAADRVGRGAGARTRAASAERNCPIEWWDELHAGWARRPAGSAAERRPVGGDRALRGARLAAGGSTGGLHLASLCGTPQLVWGPGDDERLDRPFDEQSPAHETLWNPLGTPVGYRAWGWRPGVAAVATAIGQALRQFDSPGGQRAWRAAWRVRRALARAWVEGGPAGVVPWRALRLIRLRLV
ncbi:MAG: hypothetical protein U1A27_02060 [Phycisphaerae bacterium]